MKKCMLKRMLALTLILCLACAFAVPVMAGNKEVQDAKSGVVEVILGYTMDNGDVLELSAGSGFLLNDHAVMTCYHCVEPDDDAVAFIEGQTGKEYNADRLTYHVVVSGDVYRPATIWPDAFSKTDDWAVLRLSDTINGRTPLVLGDSDQMETTDPVYALGFPDYQITNIPKYTPEEVYITNGVVSSITNSGETPIFQHDATVSNGNSGGPLVNENGEVIGINYIVVSGNGNIWSYVATRINSIKGVLKMLGVEITEAPPVSDESADTEAQEQEETPVTPPPTEEPQEQVTETPVTQEVSPSPTEDITVPTDGLDKETTDTASKFPIAIIVAAAVILVAAIIAVIVVMSNSKKKEKEAAAREAARKAAAQRNAGNNTPPAGGAGSGAAPVPPFQTGGQRPPYTVPSDGGGATTVLGGDGGAGETTVLGGSTSAAASLTRTKNGETVRINRNEFVIGKERSKVDYCVSDNGSVSRRHAKIMARGGKYYVVDLGSTNCTYLNGAKVSPNMETEIHNGDKLKFSDEEFSFRC